MMWIRLPRKMRYAPVMFAAVAAVALLGTSGGGRVAQADEPGVLSKERWAGLTEVQFAELKAAEDLYRRKSYKAAKNAYEKFMTLHSKSDVATYCQLMMAECTRLSEKPNLAISDFQFVRDIAPESDDAKWAYLRIAQCNRAAGNAEKALEIYREIFKDEKLHPTAFRAGIELTGVLEGQGKLRERVPYFEEFAERFKKNRIDPKEYEQVVGKLVYEKMLAGSVDVAYALLLTINKEPEAQRSFIGTGSGVVRELNKKKEDATKRDNIAQSVANTTMGWLREDKDRPFHQDLTRGVVFLYIGIDEGDEAAKQALAARKIYADARWTLELMVELYQRNKKLDQAIGVASEARRIHKDADWSIDLYATLVLEKGDVEQAVAAWDLMKDRKQSLSKTSQALVEAGKTAEGIARRRKLAEIDPESFSEVAMWIGGVLEKSGKMDEAIREFQLAQNEPTNLYRIAAVKSKQKKYKEAIAQYSEIGAAFEKETPNAIYHMALEYEKMDDTTTAINLLRKVCRSFPKSGSASSAHVRLQSKYKIDETLGGSEGEKKD